MVESKPTIQIRAKVATVIKEESSELDELYKKVANLKSLMSKDTNGEKIGNP